MTHLTLIIGGARSGKSSFAEQAARRHAGQVVYLATAQALDEEMNRRISKHQRKRPGSWVTVELPTRVGRQWPALEVNADVVVLDCLTLLVNNVLMAAIEDPDEPDEEQAHQAVSAEVDDLIRVIRESPADWLVVTNEVGLGLVPANPLGRLYRDLLGFTNQRFASQADQVFWMVAGIPVPIHQFRS
ncbi:MAG: bifunctional adenosylcobinamide kinase/adenosylcobinamide-phosphate guanylyltransferase [Anaerolineales bacterium]